MLKAAAVKREGQRVGERKRTRNAGRGHLAGAMADDGIRHHTPRTQQRRKPDLQREVGDMRPIGLRDARALLVQCELVEQRPAGEWAEQLVALLESGAKDRLLFQKLPSHPEPLRAHAREDERELRLQAPRVPARRDVAEDVSRDVRAQMCRDLGP